eukprot:2433268-Rhodomonas_salina.2
MDNDEGNKAPKVDRKPRVFEVCNLKGARCKQTWREVPLTLLRVTDCSSLLRRKFGQFTLKHFTIPKELSQTLPKIRRANPKQVESSRVLKRGCLGTGYPGTCVPGMHRGVRGRMTPSQWQSRFPAAPTFALSSP